MENKSEFVEIEADIIGKKKDNSPDISIIVLTHNALEYTKKCLVSIKNNTRVRYELILIDNASTDETPLYLKSEWESNNLGGNVQLWLNETNKGVAGGRNQGIEKATGDIIIFLDNDTEVGPGWDLTIISQFNHRKVGVVGKSGVDVRSLRPLAWEMVVLTGKRAEVDAVSGFCFAFRRELIDKIGNQWADFPNDRFWHEDLEFCKRVKLAGYKVIWDHNINIVHHEHKSMGNDKADIHSEVNQFGYQENASYIATRFKDDNVVFIYKDWGGEHDNSAYGRAIRGISAELRKLGLVVIRKPGIQGNIRSMNLCKMFDLGYQDKRFISLYQENDRPPRSWDTDMKYVDAVFAGSPHFIEATKGEPYANKVLDIKTAGYDPTIFNLEVEPMKFYPDKFKFLMVGASQPRKNMEGLLKAYVSAFKGKSDVILILKDGGYGKFFETRELITELRKDPECPQIEHVFGDMSDQDLASLYRAVAINGAYIHPHRAECFGMPLIEAIACGCRIGTTNWGGPIFNLNSVPTVRFFDSKLVPSTFHNWKGEPFYEKDETPMWAEPQQEDIVSYMNSVKQSVYSEDEAKVAAAIIAGKFSYKVVAMGIYDFLKSTNHGTQNN